MIQIALCHGIPDRKIALYFSVLDKKKFATVYLHLTKPYRSCGGLQPSAEVFLPLGPKKTLLYPFVKPKKMYAVCVHFSQFLVIGSNLSNLGKRREKNLEQNPKKCIYK